MVTSVAADAFGVLERGRIAEAHLADPVLVRGDLEEDVSRSHDIVAIWKDGYRGARGRLRRAGPQAEIAPAPAEPWSSTSRTDSRQDSASGR